MFRAIEAIRNCVAAGGRLLVTIPIGYNQRLDAGLRSGEVKFPREGWLVRTNRRNDWVQTDQDEAMAGRYGMPFTGANALYIGMIAD